MSNFIYLLLLYFCFNGSLVALEQENFHNFIKSFIKHYELTPEGRYVHEYHPYALKKTATSFGELEQAITSKGFNIAGRYVIIGYEEGAVPCYYTNYKRACIDDEASIKNRSGWSLKLHNRFGFMTGFLFKDVNTIVDTEQHKVFFEHINPEFIPLFDKRAIIFQEHAFGEALPLILNTKTLIVDAIKNGKHRQIFQKLVNFWDELYVGGFKIGNNQIAGTQDILFSMQYANYLAGSQIPLKKYFIGPDITYPIEVFEKQVEEVTFNAQTFVKKFVNYLTPVNDEATVYVFCSFVDGVGKSTMLGNIKNWMKFGERIDSFEHVDNSSSQLAEMFQFKKNVFIADLPAQVSHFTYKPDGYVFVDAQTEYSKEFMDVLQKYALNNLKKITHDYYELLNYVALIVKKDGWWVDELNSLSQPEKFFLKNVLLLKKESINNWYPFYFDEKCYLLNKEDPTNIRMFMPLACVKSEGLKNIESEQMLFFEGIRFPYPYKDFLTDLTQKISMAGIKNVVFVDFLSMYPRSSRENIRVNYLLQQMAYLDTSFNVANSLYRNFISGGELLFCMQENKSSKKIFDAFKLETITRFLLFEMIAERKEGDLSGYKIPELTDLIRHKINSISKEDYHHLHQESFKKYKEELRGLVIAYGMSKSFMNVQQFDPQRVQDFAAIMSDLFGKKIGHEESSFLWQYQPEIVENLKKNTVLLSEQEGFLDHCMQLKDNFSVSCLYKLHAQSKNEFIIKPFVRQLRACWYAAFVNLFWLGRDFDFQYGQSGLLIPMVPLQVYSQGASDLYIFQLNCNVWNGKRPLGASYFNLYIDGQYGIQRRYAEFMEEACISNWDAIDTHCGIFGFASFLGNNSVKRTIDNVITTVVKKYQKEHGMAQVLPTADLETLLKEEPFCIIELKNLVKNAYKNGYRKKKSEVGQSNKKQENGVIDRKVYLGTTEQIHIARILVRLIATLEMYVKDPEADIVIRSGNRDDFAAGLKIIEKFILPKYFNTLFAENLFTDYREVEPYPSWAYWERTDN